MKIVALKVLAAIIATALIASSVGYLGVQVSDPNWTPRQVTHPWINPYENLDLSRYYNANFHAHSHAWGGVTAGALEPDELYKVYRDLGFHIIGISDYMKITAHQFADSSIFPVYEHGVNFCKTHQLAIGAHDVEWIEFPWYQSLAHKQTIIRKLKHHSGLVVLAHPGRRCGYCEEQMQQLGGYDLIEIIGHGIDYQPYWDSALTSGRKIFGLANDDSHWSRPSEYALSYNIVFASTTSTVDVLDALANGRHMMVRLSSHDGMTIEEKRKAMAAIVPPSSIHLDHDSVYVKSDRNIQRLRVISDNGRIIKDVSNVSGVAVPLIEGDTYFRMAMQYDDGSELFTNPIFCNLSNNDVPPVQFTLTWVARIATFLFLLTVLIVFIRWIKK